MLVISRKESERFYIGHNREVVITIVKIDRNKVRVGIECPRDIPIAREELLEQPVPTPPLTTDRRPT